MEQNKYVIYGEEYEFQDIIICAFRYAAWRHTYVVEEVTSWIKHNSGFIDQRVWGCLKKDTVEVIEHYKNKGNTSTFESIDVDTLVAFNNWLDEYRKGYDW